LTERGDAVVVVGQEPAIVGERELSVVDRHLAVPGGDLGTQVRQLIRAHRIEADPIEIQLLFD